jgi:hypothetical protein
VASPTRLKVYGELATLSFVTKESRRFTWSFVKVHDAWLRRFSRPTAIAPPPS